MGISLLPVFMIGLLGSVHCVGMCGGIVSAISAMSASRKVFPIAVVVERGSVVSAGSIDNVVSVLSYNLGRISSYSIAGALAGGVVGGVGTLGGMAAVQTGAYWLANLVLVALGMYLIGLWQGVAYLEFAGRGIWQRLQPLTKKLLPLDNPLKLLAAGAVWGWLPCGMVYSVLFTAMLSGSAMAGASVMLAFGLGTLPAVLCMGLFGMQLKRWLQRDALRIAAGLIILGFGILGLMRAAHPGYATHAGWLDSFCVTPPASGAGLAP